MGEGPEEDRATSWTKIAQKALVLFLSAIFAGVVTYIFAVFSTVFDTMEGVHTNAASFTHLAADLADLRAEFSIFSTAGGRYTAAQGRETSARITTLEQVRSFDRAECAAHTAKAEEWQRQLERGLAECKAEIRSVRYNLWKTP